MLKCLQYISLCAFFIIKVFVSVRYVQVHLGFIVWVETKQCLKLAQCQLVITTVKVVFTQSFVQVNVIRTDPVKRLKYLGGFIGCLLYTSPSPRDATLSRMPSSA